MKIQFILEVYVYRQKLWKKLNPVVTFYYGTIILAGITCNKIVS